jgi:predicted secreted Zn-dependent protease
LSKETLSSLETSPEAKALWDEIQDEIKCERAWAIAEKHLSLARQHCAELEEQTRLIDAREHEEIARLNKLANDLRELAIERDKAAKASEARLHATVQAGERMARMLQHTKSCIEGTAPDDCNCGVSEVLDCWDAATKEART